MDMTKAMHLQVARCASKAVAHHAVGLEYDAPHGHLLKRKVREDDFIVSLRIDYQQLNHALVCSAHRALHVASQRCSAGTRHMSAACVLKNEAVQAV
eukprot:42628-Prymnesium_polylepis.1